MVYDILPERDLHYSDIRDTLNSAGGLVNNNVASAFQEAAIINKWSKKKPIRYAKDTALTETEMKGNPSDILNGIYYGLKAATVHSFEGLHDTQYQYIGRPTGGQNEPYRLSDFRGYAKDAKPTLIGYIPDWVYYNVEKACVIEIVYDYNHTNTTGVDINDFLPSNVAEDIGDYYPCILIGNYAKALYNKQTDTQTTLRHNEAWSNQFYADINNFEEFQKEGIEKASVFLLRKIFQEGLFDFRDWIDVRGMVQPFEGISVPDAAGKDLELKALITYIEIVFKNIAFVNRTNFSVLFGFKSEEPAKAITYTCSITAPGTGTKELEYDPSNSLSTTQFTFTWKELGYTVNVGQQTVTVRGTITGSDGAKINFSQEVTIPA